MRLFLILLFSLLSQCMIAQEPLTAYEKLYAFPDKLFGALHKKSNQFEKGVLTSTQKYLKKMQRSEEKMKRKLMKKDSATAAGLFGDIDSRYDSLRAKLSGTHPHLQQLYSSRIDSITTALKFLDRNGLLDRTTDISSKMQYATKDFDVAQLRLNQIDLIQKQLAERQQFLTGKLGDFGLTGSFTAFKKNVYYYRQQMDEYKKVFEEPHKTEAFVLGTLSKLPAFRKFFAKYSILGSVFRLPVEGEPGNADIGSMQTRAMLMQELGARMGGVQNAQQVVSNNISGAQHALADIKSKLNHFSSNGNAEMSDFNPNPEKTKSFLKRLEFGADIQSSRSSYFFPATTDIGFSAGYRINPKSRTGVGLSYKLGLGQDFRHMHLTHEGLGLRSFFDLKLKGSFWVTAGSEWNYRSRFDEIADLHNYSKWQQSALIGLSKKYQIRKYKGEFRFLYDFMWNRIKPSGQPFVFRTGYTF